MIAVGSVEDHDAIQFGVLAQVDLPPGITLTYRCMEAEPAVLDPVHCPGGVLPGRDSAVIDPHRRIRVGVSGSELAVGGQPVQFHLRLHQR